MKKLMLASAVFFSMLLITPLWAHHPAEGIVSDDIWQMVDDLLTEADSPHLNIDFDDVMDSMGVVTDADGNLSLVTSIVVYTQDVEDYLIYVDFAVADSNRAPSGKTNSGTANTLFVELEAVGDDMTEISIYEPVGAGNSQSGIDPKQRD